MKPIKLYFAGAMAGTQSRGMSDLGIINRLCSYHYPDQLPNWFETSKDKPGNIIVDSGAFSAWNTGAVIDIEKYIEYAKDAMQKGEKQDKIVRIVNLDVIPGEKGKSSSLSKSQIETAAKAGYFNMKKMIKAGITPIHVFHQGEEWKWLERMVEKTDYIGISPANDMPIPSRKRWVESVFEYMYKKNIKVDTHGFAVWIPELIKEFPWTSCDAATWRLLAAWGGIYYPNGGFDNPDFTKGSKSFSILSVSTQKGKKTKRGSKNEAKGDHEGFLENSEDENPFIGRNALTPTKLSMLAKDGYSFEDLQSWEMRATINIRFFLAMEKWVNEWKSKREYIPRSIKSPKMF